MTSDYNFFGADFQRAQERSAKEHSWADGMTRSRRREEILEAARSGLDPKIDWFNRDESLLAMDMELAHEIVLVNDEPPPRDPMPPLGGIAAYWMGLGQGLLEVFPGNRGEWGEPFCFRCGWLAPVKEWAERRYVHDANGRRLRSPELSDAEIGVLTWNAASGWLERCHLQDHAEGGPEAVENLVPLCVACHSYQPMCGTRAAGIAYVNNDVICPEIVQSWTDGCCRGGHRPPYERRATQFWRVVALAYQAKAATVEVEWPRTPRASS